MLAFILQEARTWEALSTRRYCSPTVLLQRGGTYSAEIVNDFEPICPSELIVTLI